MKSHYKPKLIPETPAKVFNKTRALLKKNPTKTFSIDMLSKQTKFHPDSIRRELRWMAAMGEITRLNARPGMFVRWCTPEKSKRR